MSESVKTYDLSYELYVLLSGVMKLRCEEPLPPANVSPHLRRASYALARAIVELEELNA